MGAALSRIGLPVLALGLVFLSLPVAADSFRSLPPGYGKLWWGAGPEVVQLLAPGPVALRERGTSALERYTCAQGEEASVVEVTYSLWRGVLFEVELVYDESYVAELPRNFLMRFSAHFGPWLELRHREVDGRDVPVAWYWEDDFTQQRLERDLDSGQWKMLRTSMVLGPSPPLSLLPQPEAAEEL